MADDGSVRIPYARGCYVLWSDAEYRAWQVAADADAAALWAHGIARGKAERRLKRLAQRAQAQAARDDARRLDWIHERDDMATMKATPPSAPLMNMPAPAPATAPDDIDDPETPAAVLAMTAAPAPEPDTPQKPPESSPVLSAISPGVSVPPQEEMARMALLQGFCAAVQKQLLSDIELQTKSMLRVVDAIWARAQKVVDANEHAQYQLADTLAKMTAQGLQVMQNPYSATVVATSPQGYPVRLAIVKRDAGELVEAVSGLLGWLKANEYSAEATIAF